MFVGLKSSSQPERKQKIQQSLEFAVMQLEGLDKTWDVSLSQLLSLSIHQEGC